MSFVSAIGSLQQTIKSITPSDAKPAIQGGASNSVTKAGEGSIANVELVDQTSLSAAGGFVAHALETSDTQLAKVASLQQAIATGSYSVSSSEVADKIIESLLD
jgi:negative regulator of flagellin synthesis FlgM